MAEQTEERPGVGNDRVLEVRDAICQGIYETPDVLDEAVDSVLEELTE